MYKKLTSIGHQNNKLYKIYNTLEKKGNVKSNYCVTNHVNYNNSDSETVTSNMLTSTLRDKKHWHLALSHVNYKDLKYLCNNHLLDGLPNSVSKEYINCDICLQNKMGNSSFEKNGRTRSSRILELIHTDANGLYSTTRYKREKHFVSFIDDFSKLVTVQCIQ